MERSNARKRGCTQLYEITLQNGMKVKVVPPEEYRDFISESDAEMDYRAQEAVKAALHRAKVCKKPIARYDMDTKRAYIEYPNGEREYCD